MLRIIRHDWPHSSLPDIASKLVWVGRLIAESLWADDTNRPTPPPPLCRALGSWKEKPWGVQICEGFPMFSHASVMRRRSMPLLVTRSDRAGTLSCMQWSLTVLRWRPRTSGPVLRLTSPASKRSKEKSKLSCNQGGGHIFLLPQRKRDGIDSKGFNSAGDVANMLFVVMRWDPNSTVDAKARISSCQWQWEGEKGTQ